MITIRLQTGQVLTFPDGTSDAVIQASIRRVQSGELDQKPAPAAKGQPPVPVPSPSLQIGVPRLAQSLARTAPAVQLANPPTPKPNPTAVPKPPERTPAFWRSVTGSDDPKDWAAYDRDATLQRAEAGGAASMAKLGFLDRETYYENPETGERYLKRHKSGKIPPPLDPEYRPRTAMDRLHEAYAAEGRDFPTPEDRAVDREFTRGLPERVAGSIAGATSLPLRAAEAVGTGVREEIRQFDEDLRHGHRVSTGAGFTRGASIGWEKSPAGRASDAFNRDVVEPSRDRLIEAALRAGHSPEAAAMADTGQALVAETLNPSNYIGPEELIGGVRGVRALSAPAVRAAELEARGGSRVLEDAAGLVTREYGSGSAASEIAQRRLARELAVPDEPLIYREGPDGPPRGAVGWKGQIPDTLRDITGRPWREYDPAGTGDGIPLARPESPAPKPRNVERASLEVALTGGDDASREHIAGLWDYASRRYPRIASEVREVRIDPNGAAYFDSGSGVLALPADADLGSMMHELTHVAQNARGQLVEGAESAYEPYAVRAGEVYGRVQQPQRAAIAKLDDPDARLMRALEAEFPDIRDEDYLRRRGSGVSTILDSDADYVGPGAVYGAFRPESEIEQIGRFGSRQDQDVALGMRAASKESADDLLQQSLDIAPEIQAAEPSLARAYARDISTGEPSRTRIRVMADPEAEAQRQQDLAYMRSKARPNLPGIDETEAARRQFLSDRFKALGYELSDEDFSTPITIGPEDYADETPGSSAFTSNYYPEHVFFIDDPNRGWTYRHPEFEHARMAAHETYHTTGKFGDDGVSVGFRVPELTARARELGVPNISALEEGMATRAESSAVESYLTERFPEAVQARQEMIDVVRNHGMYPNVPDSALVFIEPRKDWADAGWPFEVFARYEGPMQLVDHLVDTVPDFERLAERFRLFRDAGPLRRAVDRVYGKGTTDELLRTPEAEAGNMLQRLAAKKPVRAYAQTPKPRTPDEIAAEGMGWRLPDGPPSAVGPSLQLPDFQTNLAAQLGNDPQIADYLIQESDAVFKKIGPPQSWDTLEEMASRLGASKEQLLSDTPHWAVLSPEARLRLLYVIKGNEQKIGDLQAKLAAGAASDTEKADLLRLIETRGDLLKLGAKTGSAYGRALNSLRMEARLALSDSQIMRQQLYQKYAKQLDAEKPLMDALAKLDPGNQDELQSFLRQVDRPTFRQYLQEFWVASILSSPASHERNLIGNSINMLIENAVVRPTSALFDAARVAGTGQPREIFARETAAAVVGLGHGFRTGLRRGLEVIKRGYDPDTMSGKLFPVRSAFARSQNKVVRDIVGPFVTMPLRLLSASDAVAKTVNWTAEIYAQAARAAAKEGLSGSGFSKRVAELAANPTDDMISAANNFALKATFNDETSAVGKAISNLRDIPNASSGNPALQTGIEAYRTGMGFMLPFIHIADRLMVRGLEYSPLSAVTAIGARRAGNYAEAADLAARASIGSLVMAYAASLAMEGRITGAAPSDEGERAAFYGANKQPWSVRTEGGVWVPYGQLQPVGTPFALAAAAYKGWSEHGEAPDTEKLGHAAAQIGSYVSDQSYLSSLGKLMDVISGSETDAGRAFADVAANTVWGFMPYSGLTRSVAKGIDPRVIDAKTIGERLEQNMPVASLGMNAKLDPWGEEVVPTGGRLRTILASGTVMLTSREKSRYPVSKVYRHDAATVTGRGNVETDYNTPLQPEEQAAYAAWKARYAPNDYGMDYDYPGAFKAGVAPDPVNGHWPDTFKKPNHPTFSEESIYAQDAPGLAGHWEGDQFVPPPELGLDEELARLGMPLGYVGRTISSKRDGGMIKLTPDEHYIYQQAAGRASKLILQNLFTKEGWADLDIEAQRDEVTKAIGQARRFARFVVLRYHRKEGAPGMNPDLGYVGSVLASEDN